jgi:hypothetical protein
MVEKDLYWFKINALLINSSFPIVDVKWTMNWKGYIFVNDTIFFGKEKYKFNFLIELGMWNFNWDVPKTYIHILYEI